jgi:hypothetical protein
MPVDECELILLSGSRAGHHEFNRTTGMRDRRIDGVFEQKARWMLTHARGGTGDSC